MASTKAFTAQIAARPCSPSTSGASAAASGRALPPLLESLARVPHLMENALRLPPHRLALEPLSRSGGLPVPRPRINYPIALEGALKMKEISYIHAEGYPRARWKQAHPIIDENMPVVALCPQGRTYREMLSNIQE